ncbi:MAG: magnesium/cobalt transporter CorA [Saprospiraceae bacterium]
MKKGLPPGSIIFTGEKRSHRANLHCILYNESKALGQNVTEFPLSSISIPAQDEIVWYDLKGVHQVEVIEQLGKAFNIHPLVLEDVANINQRPKFEEFETGNFLVAQAFHFHTDSLKFQSEQISIFFGKNFLISFQEDEDELFENLINQILNGKSKIRVKKTDYLAYSLIDVIVDEYFDHLSIIEENISNLEIEITRNPVPSQKSLIYHLKRELMMFRKSVQSLREAISRMSRADNAFVETETSIFLRDLLDHLTLTLERSENYREMLTELQNLYMAEIGFKSNSVIQVLTVITSVFIPLTFIVGVYGMNFENMPELKWHYGYYEVLFLMLIVALMSLFYFKRKNWI